VAIACGGVAEREFEGVPGFAGPGAAVDVELAVLVLCSLLRVKLIAQGFSKLIWENFEEFSTLS
jgi:hypothetical protein